MPSRPPQTLEPPRWADALLGWYCAPELLEEIQGDLYEVFRKRVQQRGLRYARLRYGLDVLCFMGPHTLLREQPTYEHSRGFVMVGNYAKVAMRHLQRQKGFAFINVVGLAVGLACCLFIGLYLRHEWSYDRGYEKADRIYRVVRDVQGEDGVSYSARNPVPLGPTLAQEYPEVTEVVRFWRSFQSTLGYENQTLREPGLYFADPGVFEVFSLDLLQGNPQTALVEPFSIVLTESAAQRYFGEAEPLGQVLDYDGYPGADSLQFTVTGILRDVPENTHLAFTALASLEGIETESDNFGSYKPLWTYVLLPEGTSPEPLETKLPDFVERHLASSTTTTTLHLEPITDIHLHSRYDGGFKPKGDSTYLYLFGAVGFFILLIACVNFINLATARAAKRAREVGMRKVLGAHRQQLIGQFLGEALLLTGLAVLLAVGLVVLLLPAFNSQFDTALRLGLEERWLWAALPSLVLGVGLLAGIYPALVLSGFRPAIALRSQLAPGASGLLLRKGLVVFQFAVSVVLIAGTVVVYYQLHYLRHKDLGFNKEQVVVMPYSPNEEAVRAAFEWHPSIMSVSVSQRVPVNTISSDGRGVIPEGFEEPVRVDSYIIDDAFAETFGIEVVAGRSLSKDRATDAEAFLINETAVQRFGWGAARDALGKTVQWNDSLTGPVVGVVRDFHLDSMHEAIPPVVLQMMPEEQWWRTFISAKIRPNDVPGSLAFLEETWRSLTPDGAYEYFFLDESFEQLHRADVRFGRIFTGFAGLAIIIACLGLFGLAAFTAEQRTKEIGVRKVLGATVPGLVLLLSKEFTQLVVLGLLIAVPLAYFSMHRWLDGFAYRIELGVMPFVVAGGLTLAIAFLTVSYQAIRAALADPVKSLRYE